MKAPQEYDTEHTPACKGCDTQVIPTSIFMVMPGPCIVRMQLSHDIVTGTKIVPPQLAMAKVAALTAYANHCNLG